MKLKAKHLPRPHPRSRPWSAGAGSPGAPPCLAVCPLQHLCISGPEQSCYCVLPLASPLGRSADHKLSTGFMRVVSKLCIRSVVFPGCTDEKVILFIEVYLLSHFRQLLSVLLQKKKRFFSFLSNFLLWPFLLWEIDDLSSSIFPLAVLLELI